MGPSDLCSTTLSFLNKRGKLSFIIFPGLMPGRAPGQEVLVSEGVEYLRVAGAEFCSSSRCAPSKPGSVNCPLVFQAQPGHCQAQRLIP